MAAVAIRRRPRLRQVPARSRDLVDPAQRWPVGMAGL